ncbi:MAG TPA: SGNH/GDSL hydrolase family protein [Egibacteraceae bacterium]|nr:SGNH/GDSL hydrolase family protein [Egibacteraceae bacterium]
MAALIALGALGALVALLLVQIQLVRTADYLPDDPGYVVEADILAGAGGTARAPLELVLLGDSTVAGVGAPTVSESLSVLVAQRVAAALDRPVHVVGYGVSGARTHTVRAEQLPLVAGAPPDALLIVVGSNDATHAAPPWVMRKRTRALLADAAEIGAPVVLGGIPEFKTTPAFPQPLRLAVGLYADVLRRVQRDVAAQMGVGFVNIAAEASPRFLDDPSSMSADGFHPAPLGYGFWADALAPAVVAAIDEPR